MFSYYIIDLQQECPTYSPRAQSGPPGISIRPARLPRNVKNDRFVSIRWCFSSSKIRQARTPPQIPVGELTTLPRPRSRLGRETPLPIPFPLDAFVISIWPMTSLKLYTWPSGQKGWTPLIYSVVLMCLSSDSFSHFADI